MAASAFSHMATSNKYKLIFLKLLWLIKSCHNWFLKKLKQHMKKTRSYHHTFLFFLCENLSFINTMQKNIKTFQKMFQFLRWMRKNFIPRNFSWRVLAETWDASCFQKGLLEKQQSVPNTCDILSLKEIFFQNLKIHFSNISILY